MDVEEIRLRLEDYWRQFTEWLDENKKIIVVAATILLLLLSVSFILLSTQGNRVVKIKVSGSAGPIDGARVAVVSGGKVIAEKTVVGGFAEFTLPSSLNETEVRVSKEGFEEKTVAFNASANKSLELTLESSKTRQPPPSLTPSPSPALTASPTSTPQVAPTLSPEPSAITSTSSQNGSAADLNASAFKTFAAICLGQAFAVKGFAYALADVSATRAAFNVTSDGRIICAAYSPACTYSVNQTALPNAEFEETTGVSLVVAKITLNGTLSCVDAVFSWRG